MPISLRFSGRGPTPSFTRSWCQILSSSDTKLYPVSMPSSTQAWCQALTNLTPAKFSPTGPTEPTPNFAPRVCFNADVNFFQNFHQNFNQTTVACLVTAREQSWRLVRHLSQLVTAFDAGSSSFLKPRLTSTTRVNRLGKLGTNRKNNSLPGGFKKKNSRHCCRLFSYFLISSMIIAIVKINTTVSRILPIIFSPNSRESGN